MMNRPHCVIHTMSRFICTIFAVIALLGPAARADGTDEPIVIPVFDGESISCDQDAPSHDLPEGSPHRFEGQFVTRTLDLPAAPATQDKTLRIIAVFHVEPIRTPTERGPRPNDPWTRLGAITLVDPHSQGEKSIETELVRFITPFGGPADYEQDVTPLAPMLHGAGKTIIASIATRSDEPGWKLSLELRYTTQGVGARRPVFAERLIYSSRINAELSKAAGQITLPEGLATPRLRVLTTGHASDGQGGNEFITCTHILRIDGQEIIRWRPWSERGGEIRSKNPMSGRRTINGREIRSSDFDRSGWLPGLVVEPLIIPVPELTPGPHRIEIEILGIRPKDPRNEEGLTPHGYWMLSAIVVADEPWPGLAE